MAARDGDGAIDARLDPPRPARHHGLPIASIALTRARRGAERSNVVGDAALPPRGAVCSELDPADASDRDVALAAGAATRPRVTRGERPFAGVVEHGAERVAIDAGAAVIPDLAAKTVRKPPARDRDAVFTARVLGAGSFAKAEAREEGWAAGGSFGAAHVLLEDAAHRLGAEERHCRRKVGAQAGAHLGAHAVRIFDDSRRRSGTCCASHERGEQKMCRAWARPCAPRTRSSFRVQRQPTTSRAPVPQRAPHDAQSCLTRRPLSQRTATSSSQCPRAPAPRQGSASTCTQR